MPDYQIAEAAAEAVSGQHVRELYHELRAHYAGRNGEFFRLRQYYHGEHWGNDDEMVVRRGRNALVVNYVRPTVDKTVQMLLGDMPGIQVVPPGVDPISRRRAEALEALLYMTWKINSLPKVLRRVAHNMVLLKMGLVYYWWDPSMKRVRIRSISPDNFFPVYDGEDLIECVIVSRRNTRALQRSYPNLANKISETREGNAVLFEGYGGDLAPADHAVAGLDRATAAGQTVVLDYFDRDGQWTRVMGDAVHSQKLGYGTHRVPVIEFPNNLPGDETDASSEVDDIIQLNLHLDKVLSQAADIIQKYSNPTVIDYGSGQDPQMVKRTIQSEGGVLPAKPTARIEFLNWTGTPPAIEEHINRVLMGIFDLSGKPQSAYGQTVTNQSGVMTNLALTPTVQINAVKQSIFGLGLEELNRDILMLYEKFANSEDIEISLNAFAGMTGRSRKFYNLTVRGSDVDGWYENRIKWPSAMRTDDPVYVQTELSKMKGDSENPPAQSQYTTMENLGIEDVEAERDRIAQELEDPRLHPGRTSAALEAAAMLGDANIPADLEGLAPGAGGISAEEMNGAAVAGGSPNRDALVEGV